MEREETLSTAVLNPEVLPETALTVTREDFTHGGLAHEGLAWEGIAAADVDYPGAGDEVAALRQMLDERDQALLNAAISVTELTLELDASKEEASSLKSKLRYGPNLPMPEQPERDLDAGKIVRLDARSELRAQMEPDPEIEKVRKEWVKTQKLLERAQAERKADNARMRSQLHEVEQQRNLETRARRMESAQSSAKIANLQKDVQGAMARVATAEAAAANGARPNVRLAAASATAAAILAALTTWVSMPKREVPANDRAVAVQAPKNPGGAIGKVAVPSSAAAAPVTGLSLPGAALSNVSMPSGPSAAREAQKMVASPLSPEARQGFEAALGRLNRVLTAFPNRKPEQVLREAHEAYLATDPTVCLFEWNQGQPAVLYSAESGNLNLSASLSKCAAALEKQVRPK